jgi:hypothetical protein
VHMPFFVRRSMTGRYGFSGSGCHPLKKEMFDRPPCLPGKPGYPADN